MIYIKLLIMAFMMLIIPREVPQVFAEHKNSFNIEQEYYEIRTAEELHQMRTTPEGIYILMNDIDMAGYSEWEPIEVFSGTLDGQGYTIKGLEINVALKKLGLVGINTGEIKDMILESPEVDSKNQNWRGINGGFIAGNNEGLIERVYVKLGSMNNITIKKGGLTGSLIGGIVGWNSGQITDCFIDAQIKGRVVGGLVGKNEKKGIVECSSVSGRIESDYQMGGLVGSNLGKIENCFSNPILKVVEGNPETYVGGIAGENTGNINYCYTTAKIEGNSIRNFGVAPLGDVSKKGKRQSFYNKDILKPNFKESLIECEGKSTEELKLKSTYEEQGWDFGDIWEIDHGEGYAYLKRLEVGPPESSNPVPPEEPEVPIDPPEPEEPEIPDGPGDLPEPGEPEIPDGPGDLPEPGEPEIPDGPGDLPEPGEPELPDSPGDLPEPGEPELPDGPGDLPEPEEPELPDGPGDLPEPGEPELPDGPGDPPGPEEPAIPDGPGDLPGPEEPAIPDGPGDLPGPGEPELPDGPGDPPGPEEPAIPDDPGDPSEPEASEDPADYTELISSTRQQTLSKTAQIHKVENAKQERNKKKLSLVAQVWLKVFANKQGYPIYFKGLGKEELKEMFIKNYSEKNTLQPGMLGYYYLLLPFC